MTADEIADLWRKAREWQAEAETAPIHMRGMYRRMAAACRKRALDAVEEAMLARSRDQ